MEHVNMDTAKDNERIYRVIGDLISQNKEFQIMITVPSTVQKEKKNGTPIVQMHQEPHDLEKDVTDMIHDIESGFNLSISFFIGRNTETTMICRN